MLNSVDPATESVNLEEVLRDTTQRYSFNLIYTAAEGNGNGLWERGKG